MRRLLKWMWLITALALTLPLLTSCGSSDYKILSVKEGIGQFSLEYPPEYSVTRIDIRDEPTSRYTDIGLGLKSTEIRAGLNEISVYAWPVDSPNDTATLILTDMLAHGEVIFPGFELIQRFSVMIGDMEGQAAVFYWIATPTNGTGGENTLPAVSRIACFRHSDVAWEVHVASDLEAQAQGEAEFNHVLETFQILN